MSPEKARLSNYTKTQLKPIVDMFLNDLTLKYGVALPKYQFSDLSKGNDDAAGVYLSSTKMIILDYDAIVNIDGDLGILTNVLCHEFIHYIENLDHESQGKDFSEVCANRKEFYEMRAPGIGA